MKRWFYVCFTLFAFVLSAADAQVRAVSRGDGVLSVELDSFTYFRPTSSDSDHPAEVYSPIVRDGDTLNYRFKLKIVPNSGLTGVKFQKIKVLLMDGNTELATEDYVFSGSLYPTVTMVSGTGGSANIDPLTIPMGITDGKTYTFRIDAYVEANGSVLEFRGIDTKSVEAHFNAVAVGRKIAGEDNGSDAAREQVKLTILNRWNFPAILNGRSFTRSVLRGGNSTIYDLATDSGIFIGTAALDDTVQHARQLARDLLANPNSASGSGPIYFYAASASSGPIYDLCNDADDAEVNLLHNTATCGNKYFSPSSDPNSWTTQTVKDGCDADPNDSLTW